MKAVMILLSSMFVMACSTGNCRNATPAEGAVAVAGASKKSTTKPGEEAAVKTSSAERVKVAKPDGSLQCGQGKAIAVAEMQKELQNIKVHSAVNKNDGLMRIQVCGSPTGNHNVYEIDRKDLDKALSLGFKEWTAE